MNRIMRALFAPILPAFLAIPLAAQSGSVEGRVTSTAGAGLGGAAILVEGTALRATTDDDGTFVARGVPP